MPHVVVSRIAHNAAGKETIGGRCTTTIPAKAIVLFS